MARVDIKEQLAIIAVKLDDIKQDITELKALEKRVDEVENFNSKIRGGGMIIGAIMTALLGLMMSVLGGIFK